MPGLDVPVVVVHYQRDDLTDRLLHDLMTVAGSSVGVVVVVDNGSAVPYAAPLGYGDRVRVVRLDDGLGYGGAVMAGREEVEGPCFAVLNNDVELPADPFPALAERWRRSSAAAVGPAVEFPDGRFQLSWGDRLSLSEEFRERRRQQQMRRGGGAALLTREHESASARPVDWLSGVMLLLDADAFDAVGGFDDAYWFSFEDVDLCQRLSLDGYELWYEPSSRIRHALGATRDSLAGTVPARIGMAPALGHLRYYRRHRPKGEALALKLLLLLQVSLSGSYRGQPWRRRLLSELWRS